APDPAPFAACAAPQDDAENLRGAQGRASSRGGRPRGRGRASRGAPQGSVTRYDRGPRRAALTQCSGIPTIRPRPTDAARKEPGGEPASDPARGQARDQAAAAELRLRSVRQAAGLVAGGAE